MASDKPTTACADHPDEALKFDFQCSTCEENGLIVEAAFYCSVCLDFCCNSCQKNHDSLKATKRHLVFGRDKVSKWDQQAKHLALATTVCPDHTDKALKLLCLNHKTLCCSMCVSLHHKACTDMVYVPKIAKDIKQSQDIDIVGQNVDEIIQYTDEMINYGKESQTTLDKSKQNYLDNIEDIQQQVNDFFNNLKKSSSNEMDKLHNSKVNDLQTLMKSLDDYKNKLAQLQNATQKSSTNNESQLFIEMFTAHQQLPTFLRELHKLGLTTQTTSFHLDRDPKDPKLQEIFTTIKSLGELKEYKTTFQRELPTIKPLPLLQLQQLYTASNGRDIEVKMSSDNEVCYIHGSCQMPNGDILLTYTNKKVICLDPTYKPTAYLDLPDIPISICCMADKEAVVTDNNSTIHFLSITRSKMSVTKSLKMDHFCYGIAHHNGRLFVSNNYRIVNIYTTSGKHMKTVQTDNNGANIFSLTRHICVSPDGSKIYVADWDKGLVTLDSEGNHLSTYTKDLKNACSVSVDRQGRVLAGGEGSYNVLQLHEGGTTWVGEVVGEGHGITRPVSICIDNHNSTLIVGGGNSNIKVFDLK